MMPSERRHQTMFHHKRNSWRNQILPVVVVVLAVAAAAHPPPPPAAVVQVKCVVGMEIMVGIDQVVASTKNVTKQHRV